MNEETKVPAPPAQPTPEEMFKSIYQQRAGYFRAIGDAERMGKAKKRGLLTDKGYPTAALIELDATLKTDVLVTPDQLRPHIVLEGDNLRYTTTIKRDGKLVPCAERVAHDKHGLPAFPKGKGRHKKHHSRADSMIKLERLAAFKLLFAELGGKLLLAAREKGEEFLGIPETEMAGLYKRSAVVGLRNYNLKEKAARRRARRATQFSRKVNAGIIPGNTNRAHFING